MTKLSEGELQKSLAKLLHETGEMGLSQVTMLEIATVHKTISDVVEEAKKDAPRFELFDRFPVEREGKPVHSRDGDKWIKWFRYWFGSPQNK